MDEIDDILQRYSLMESNGSEMYFDADEIVDLLDHFEETDDFRHYEKLLELGRKLHPENQDIKIRNCRASIIRGEPEQALRLIERMGEPDNLELNLLKMECFCLQERYGEVRAFVAAQEKERDREELQDIYEYLASVMVETAKSGEADEFILRGMKLFPDSLILKEEYCFSMEVQGKPQPALLICKELLDVDPYSKDYWYMQGRIYLMMGKYNKAIDAFDFALVCKDSDVEIKPVYAVDFASECNETDVEIKVLKAYCLLVNERYDDAKNIYLELLAEQQENESIELMSDEFYMKAKSYEQAYAIFSVILDNPEMLNELEDYRDYFHNAHKIEGGDETDEESLVDSFPQNVLMLSIHAFMYMMKGARDEAVEVAEQVLKILYRYHSKQKNLPSESEEDNYGELVSNVNRIIRELHELLEPYMNETIYPVRLAVTHLMDGNVEEFCRIYAECSSEVIVDYLQMMFIILKAIHDKPKPKKGFLSVDEISGQVAEYVSSDRLSASYLANKYHKN